MKAIEEKDRWAVHIEFFKIAIALPTAVIALAGAIFSDDTRIPSDSSRYLLAFGVGFFVLALICAAMGFSALASHFLEFNGEAKQLTTPPAADEIPALTTPAPKTSHRWLAVFFANASLLCIGAGGLSLGGFFAMKAWNAGAPSFDRAIALGLRGLSLDPGKHESATFRSIDLLADKYTITYVITPGGGLATAVTDATGEHLVSARKP